MTCCCRCLLSGKCSLPLILPLAPLLALCLSTLPLPLPLLLACCLTSLSLSLLLALCFSSLPPPLIPPFTSPHRPQPAAGCRARRWRQPLRNAYTSETRWAVHPSAGSLPTSCPQQVSGCFHAPPLSIHSFQIPVHKPQTLTPRTQGLSGLIFYESIRKVLLRDPATSSKVRYGIRE